ncbi:hypothetical protein G3480_10240 [Thiorhodococcus mannitoliphagus]|uniref:Uncharacterized protein n=1 Tax=Thiorhodococcus mannitoliphagus TaxID=329406 RepID=A0A6P1DU22_9GAMM|nr:hypothetical protein [Thiorhodococcus mannitoliphagus]NEX20683.1 hypothetical protein [Thiorhodococcus mannitoliphagus]
MEKIEDARLNLVHESEDFVDSRFGIDTVDTSEVLEIGEGRIGLEPCARPQPMRVLEGLAM